MKTRSDVSITELKVRTFQDDARITGQCGGYCGSCYPQDIKLRVL